MAILKYFYSSIALFMLDNGLCIILSAILFPMVSYFLLLANLSPWFIYKANGYSSYSVINLSGLFG